MRWISLPTLLVLLMLAGCGGSRVPAAAPAVTLPASDAPTPPPAGDGARPSASTTAGTATVPPTTAPPDPSPAPFTALKAAGPLDIYARPSDPAPVRALPSTTILGTPTVVLVREWHGQWARVALPGRPNGAEGWVRLVNLERIETERKVVVDLSDHRLQIWEGEQLLLETEVAIGSERSPTPTGSFFVTDAVRILQEDGPWGPFAFGLSARSDTVTEFNGGDGIIGIHGTNQPGTIGSAASLGCVRVHNQVMAEVWELVHVGMPVEIKA